jgi:hypothetical protein
LGADVLVGDEIDLHGGVRRNDRADIAAFDHDVPYTAELALPVAHDLAHTRIPCDDGNHPVDFGLPDRRGHIGAVDPDAVVLVEPHGLLLRESRDRIGVREVEVAPHREPGERAVHRARVEVAEVEPLGERARHSALARSRRSVDRDDHLRTTESRRS